VLLVFHSVFHPSSQQYRQDGLEVGEGEVVFDELQQAEVVQQARYEFRLAREFLLVDPASSLGEFLVLG
jgi:hypothetical protein